MSIPSLDLGYRRLTSHFEVVVDVHAAYLETSPREICQKWRALSLAKAVDFLKHPLAGVDWRTVLQNVDFRALARQWPLR